jgi:hypothetical protein
MGVRGTTEGGEKSVSWVLTLEASDESCKKLLVAVD